ncbi:MAG: nucleotide exchange factor GrpE [Blastocatellia bacterium]|nr:nucleotide exchange factor GrpE [Blastocatellia bacterium]
MASESQTISNDRSEIERLLGENEKLKDELRQEHEIYLRSIADFDNFRKRVERERAAESIKGRREIVLSLLEILDDFEHALAHIERSPASAGFHTIHRQMVNLLHAQGVTSFESVGQPFDPALHEAVGSEESTGREPGTVLDDLRTGYRWGDELLRPARVRVAR